MKLIKLAIVGRPNVGKSLLFNRICQKRVAIVDEEEGVTRDRIYAKAYFKEKPFEVIDTAGISFRDKLAFDEEVKLQTMVAIEEADHIVMVVDGATGLCSLDKEVANMLLKAKKPLTLAINKIDDHQKEYSTHQFFALGITKSVNVSALNNFNISYLLETAFEKVDFESQEEEPSLNVAIVGRVNVGKSTLFNALVKDNRSIVSDVPATTRDSIDSCIVFKEKSYTFIDTAGIRRKKAENNVIEKFAAIRTEESIKRADICIVVLDSNDGLTAQEKRILQRVEEEKKGCIIILNKWDLIKGFRMEHAIKGIAADFAEYPILCISAKDERNVDKIFSMVDQVEKELKKRITTGTLNKFFEKSLQKYHPPMIKGKRLRLYYLTQVSDTPPKFIAFVNKPSLMTQSYKKYLVNQLRENFGFLGAPITFDIRGKVLEEN